MSRWYLGIDTSNYRTSCALFDAESGQWHNAGRLLDVPAGTIGLRQSDALFQHTQHLHEMIAQLPQAAVRAVCVSTRPRAVEGSYMPCFLAGVNVARSAAHLLGVPVYDCSHQQGHLAAAALSASCLSCLLTEPFYAWHLSGGTTELVRVQPAGDRMPQAVCIGGTTDLAAGQLIDRAGALLGLDFPAGPALETLAVQAQDSDVFRPKVQNCRFSLSGVENQIKDRAARGVPPAEIAAFTLRTVGEAVVRATAQALQRERLPVLCAGGVMSCQMLQARMKETFGAYVAAPRLSGDNAVGPAVLAAVQHGEEIL